MQNKIVPYRKIHVLSPETYTDGEYPTATLLINPLPSTIPYIRNSITSSDSKTKHNITKLIINNCIGIFLCPIFKKNVSNEVINGKKKTIIRMNTFEDFFNTNMNKIIVNTKK